MWFSRAQWTGGQVWVCFRHQVSIGYSQSGQRSVVSGQWSAHYSHKRPLPFVGKLSIVVLELTEARLLDRFPVINRI